MTKQRMSANEFRNRYGKPATENKYHNIKTEGHASRKEHRRAEQLKLLEMAGVITNLQEQVPFLLVPAQRDETGFLVERGVTYKADFVYRDVTGTLVVEDTKGVRTPAYVIKRKLMLQVYGIRVKEL